MTLRDKVRQSYIYVYGRFTYAIAKYLLSLIGCIINTNFRDVIMTGVLGNARPKFPF